MFEREIFENVLEYFLTEKVLAIRNDFLPAFLNRVAFLHYWKMTLEKVYVPSKLGFVSPAIVLQEFLQSAFEAEDELYTFFHHTKRAKSNETEDDTRKSFFNFIERNGQFSEAAEQVISEVE